MRRFRLICCPLSLLLGIQSLGAVRGEHASYVGGTVTSMKKGVQGALDMSDLKTLRFEYEGGEFMLPYRQIATLESGQKVGRRVGAALAGVAMIGLIPGLIILSSKKKKHYLTIGYRNEAGEGQAVVFELAKSTVSSILPTLETRTGLK